MIKNEVKRLTGIPVSIGVGPNKTLAKLTSHMAKQDTSYNGICSYWTLQNFRNSLYKISVDEVWGVGRQWKKKLNNLDVFSIGQFINLNDGLIRKLMNINGLKTKMELLGEYCYQVKPLPKAKRNIASTRSFGEDISEFNQIAEAMYTYIKSGVKKLKDNGLATNRATIFISGNYHKGNAYTDSKQITLNSQTTDIQSIWSQVYPYLQEIYSSERTYKKCGIIFNELKPHNISQGTLFQSNVEPVEPPTTTGKGWEMRQDFLTQKYTTQWDDIPVCLV